MGAYLQTDLVSGSFAASGLCLPWGDVGGDYYEYLSFDDARLGVVIGDVTGHDDEAAVPAAAAQGILHARPEVGRQPGELLKAVEGSLVMRVQRLLLMSCCYVLLDAERRCLRYANAGHPCPYHFCRASARVEPLTALDPILGAEASASVVFQQDTRSWNPGDLLILYTDGFTEVRDRAGHQLDDDLIERCVTANAHRSPSAIRRALLDALFRHAGGIALRDDMTLVVVKAV